MFGRARFACSRFAGRYTNGNVTLALTGQALSVAGGSVAVALPIVNNVGMSVADLGGNSYRLTKVSGGAAYNADAVGTVGYSGDFVLRISPASAFNGGWFAGMNSDPLTDSGFTSIDYAFLTDSANWYIYESGTGAIGSPLAINTYGWIWRSGTNLYYSSGATFAAAAASPARTVAGVTATLYFDSTFGADGTITDIQLTDTVPVYLSGQAVTVAGGSVAPQSSVATTGQALTAARGTVAGQTSITVTGQSATAARGTATANLTLALAGQSLSVARGSVVAVGGDVNAAITGQSLSVARGTILLATDKALTGQANTVTAGTVAAQTALAATGQSLTVARGSVVAAPGVALAGQSTAVARGALPAATGLALTGQSIVVARGTVTAGSDVIAALVGQTLSAAQGSAVSAFNLALTGSAIAIAQGGIAAAAADVTAALTGQSVTASRGTLPPTITRLLAGQGVASQTGVVSALVRNTFIRNNVPADAALALSLLPGAVSVTVAALPSVPLAVVGSATVSPPQSFVRASAPLAVELE